MEVTMATYPNGTQIEAECIEATVIGTLVGDYDTLDEVLTVLTDDGETIRINGWLWSIEVPE
jgi:hypothetical protein